MSKYPRLLKENVIETSLCSGCGTCAGVCMKNCITFSGKNHKPIIDLTNCVECGLCYKSCPGKGFKFASLKDDTCCYDDRIGPYLKFIMSYSTDDELRKKGASGGSVSAIFKYALEKRKVDKVLCVKKNDNDYEAVLIEDAAELSLTQGSKYIPLPLNVAIKDIINNNWKVALIGTPCELQGLYLAAQSFPKLNDLLIYKIGLFCGFAQSKECVEALRNYLGTVDSEWDFDGWRCGEYPGYVRFTNRNSGEIRQLLIYEALNIAVPFYSMEKCFMCPDGTNVCSDISFGDVHSRSFDENSGIVRTRKGLELIEEMKQDGYIVYKEQTFEEAMRGTVGSVAYQKGMRALLYIASSHNPVPKYDIRFNKNRYKQRSVIQNRIQCFFYKFVRKKRVLAFFEKNPKLQMKIGRYIYTYPSRSLLYRFSRKLKHIIKGNKI